MKHRILVVDDSSSLVSILSELLKVNGFEVETALSGTEALHKIESEDYDLVICDIEMPGMSGLEFLSRVRRDYEKDIAFILMTGYADNEYFLEAIRLGASDFIHKPIDSKQMMRSIQTILKRKKKRSDFSEFYNNLEKAEFHFELDPRNFSKFAVSEVFHNFLRQNFDLTPNALNEILICIDEMVYNAYIHGTLGLNVQERVMEHNALQKIINERLQQPEIASKRMRLYFSLCYKTQTIKITVEDDGPGFDYETWIKRVANEPKLNLEENGRGIAMLYHLSDKLEFDREGRTVTISKKLPINNKK